MNDPTEPRTSLLLPPSSFSYFIFTFLDRRKSANLWVIRPLCRVDPHRVYRGLGAYRTIRRRVVYDGSLYTASRPKRVDTFPFCIPLCARGAARFDSARLGSAPRRVILSTCAEINGTLTFPDEFSSRPSKGDFQRRRAPRGERAKASTINKNLGQDRKDCSILFTATSTARNALKVFALFV